MSDFADKSGVTAANGADSQVPREDCHGTLSSKLRCVEGSCAYGFKIFPGECFDLIGRSCRGHILLSTLPAFYISLRRKLPGF